MTARGLSIVAIFLLALAPGAIGQDESVDELAKRVHKQRDDVDPAIFDQLAAHADAASFRALEKGIGRLRKDERRATAYLAFRYYAYEPELRPRAVEWLRREAGRGKSALRKQAAVIALTHFDAEITEVLEAILARNKDLGCKTLACDALVPVLVARGDPESLELVLEHASLVREARLYPGAPGASPAEGRGTHAEVVRRQLAGVDGPELRASMIARLANKATPTEWKQLLVELLAPRSGVEVSEGLAAALRDKDPAIAGAALEALQARDDWDDYEEELRALFSSTDASLRRAAVLALGRIAVGRADWQVEVQQLSRHKDSAVRMGAVACLGDLRTPPEIARMHEMLGDPEWAVRVEVLERIGKLRLTESVPILIQRLVKERGRLRWDIYAVLRALTGVDHGHLADRWLRWWEAEGGSFELPTADEAADAERERVESGKANRTVASSFYGLEVLSERVQFVFDISGSMALPPGVYDPAAIVSPGTKRRIDIAKAQLVEAIKALEDERMFNIIFFDTELRPFKKHLVRMRPKTRGEALRFVDSQIALGATAMYPALEMAFRDPLVDTMFILADGAPTVGEFTDIREIRARVARWNVARKVRIHGVAMGIDSDLLRWLAEDTGGTYTRVD